MDIPYFGKNNKATKFLKQQEKKYVSEMFLWENSNKSYRQHIYL